ncbi:MAG: hypothetical protein NUV67_01710, partial [archaeon]|nr:hypothetical protein [archaeon]
NRTDTSEEGRTFLASSDCCAPDSLDAKNVLPSSLVSVRFLREGFYFNSLSPTWAGIFHFSNPKKRLREERKREYCYDFFPVGPFSRGGVETVLLADALSLFAAGEAEIISRVALHWKCLVNESALSGSINFLRSTTNVFSSSFDAIEAGFVSSKGLFFQGHSKCDPQLFFASKMAGVSSETLSSLYFSLTSSSSRFFNPNLAILLELVAAGIHRDFGSILADLGPHKVSFLGSNALVDSGSLMLASKRLGNAYSLEKWLFSGFSKNP